ncbi:MAG TPA: DUF3048 domain-containing protein [Clostridia bacterium]|nr:DUF3048 domain-containing protein [Clostridia bacterium]
MLFAFLTILLSGCNSGKSIDTGQEQGQQETQPKFEYICPLDGLVRTFDNSSDLEKFIERRPLIVTIENHPAARPQFGLEQACLVYEFLAEGNITRFLAVYLHQEPDKIGPIRSARPYFLDKAMELDAIYAHCGQSPQAELEIPKFKIRSINEIGGAGIYFWRDNTKRAPHNLYSSVEKLRQYAEKKGWEKKTEPKGFNFAPDVQINDNTINKVIIDYPGSYEVTYNYDPETGVFLRNMEGKPHLAGESNRQLTAQNIAVLYANKTRVIDNEGRLEIDLLGEGKAVFFIGNQMVEGKWKKDSRSTPTYFYDQDGKEITFKTGQTWIQVVSSTTKLIAE